MLQPRAWLRPAQWHAQLSHRSSPNLLLRRLASTEAAPPADGPDGLSDGTVSKYVPATFAERPTLESSGNIQMRTYKPRTPGLRHLKRPINDHLWKGRPEYALTFPRKGHGIGGRNNSGRIMVRHRGGGHKRRIRIVDFHRMAGGNHVVERIEHDPGRSAHVALVRNKQTTEKTYIVAAEGMREGDVVQSYRSGIPESLIASMGGVRDPAMIAAKTAWRGNCLPLHMISPGTLVYNVGLYRNKGAQLCRSAGTYATVLSAGDNQLAKWKDYVNVKLQSGEVRRIHKDACATIGVASNVNYNRRQLGKAGRARWLGIRPTVRGLAMNASDHPHGGGRGKSKGNVHPISIWGRTPAKGGFKTRKKSNVNKAVVTPRIRNMGKRRRDQSERR